MIIEYCDICEHSIGHGVESGLNRMAPQIYKTVRHGVPVLNGDEIVLCNKCRDRLFRVIRMESRKQWKKELKEMRK